MKPTLFKECCVCLQTKFKVTKCKKCKKVAVCNDCIISMCEQGICNKCPVCRQEDWRRKSKTNQSKIVPDGHFSVIIQNENSRCCSIPRCRIPPCCICTREDREECVKLCKLSCNKYTCIKAIRLLQMTTIIYMGGILTVFLIVGKDFEYPKLWWVPMLVGFAEFLLLVSCCYGCCGMKVGIKEVCFFSLEKI